MELSEVTGVSTFGVHQHDTLERLSLFIDSGKGESLTSRLRLSKQYY